MFTNDVTYTYLRTNMEKGNPVCINWIYEICLFFMANFTICTVITMHIVNMGQMKLIVSYIYLQCDTVFSYAHTCVDYLLWFPTHVFCSHRKKTRKCDSNISAIWSLLSFLSFLRERERERERDMDLLDSLFHSFMHLLASSYMCPDRGPNSQPWHIGMMLLPGQGLLSFLLACVGQLNYSGHCGCKIQEKKAYVIKGVIFLKPYKTVPQYSAYIAYIYSVCFFSILFTTFDSWEIKSAQA